MTWKLTLTCLSLLASHTEPVRSVMQTTGNVTLYAAGDSLLKGKLQLRLSSHLRLTVRVEGPASTEVDSFRVEADGKEWSVAREERPSRVGGNWQKVVDLDPLKPGELKVPPVSLRHRDGPGQEWRAVRFTDVEVDVLTAAEADARDVRGELPIETLPEQPHWTRHLPVAAATVVGGGLLALLLVLLGRRPRAVSSVPPHERALAELNALEQAGPPPGAPPDWLHTRISGVVRRYLEERFSLRASRQTTEEFFAEIDRSDHLDPHQRQTLRDLLARCDLAKFTGLPPSAPEWAEAAELARSFVRQTSPQPR